MANTIISQLARFEMLKGKEIEACNALQKLAGAVKANEPGCLMYAVTRGQVNPQEIYVYEMYADQASADAHRKTDHIREFQSKFADYMNRAAFNLEILDEVGGFIRQPVEELTGQM